MITKSFTKAEALGRPSRPLPDLVAKIKAPADGERLDEEAHSPVIMRLRDQRQFVIVFDDTLAGGSDGRPWFYSAWSDAAADLAHLQIGFRVVPGVIY